MSVFYQKVADRQKTSNSLLCIGLDSDVTQMPLALAQERYPQFAFNKAIITATHDLVLSYKPNSAFYEARGEQGIAELKMTCDFIKQNFPDIIIILDAKRADIGNTNLGYLSFAYDFLEADAITLHPYLGFDALKPFLDRKDKGSIVLCRTSNPGAGEFQDMLVDGQPLYQRVAQQVAKTWNANENCALVVGATYPSEMRQLRQMCPNMPFLIPGIGTQGGQVQQAVAAGTDVTGGGAFISVSRSIIFASKEIDYADRARVTAAEINREINKYRGEQHEK